MPINWFAKLKNIPLTIVIVLADLFLLVNAPMFVESGAVGSYRSLLSIYLILLISFRTFVPQGVFEGGGIGNGVLYFGIGLVGTSLIFTGGDFINILQTFQLERNAPILILATQALVVAFIEEDVFRNRLPAVVGVIPAQIAFSLYHFSAYGGSIMGMILAFVAGLVFYGMDRLTGSLYVSVGSHASYNLFAMSILAMI